MDIERLFRIGWVVIVVSWIFALAVFAGVIYVGTHFIMKIW